MRKKLSLAYRKKKYEDRIKQIKDAKKRVNKRYFLGKKTIFDFRFNVLRRKICKESIALRLYRRLNYTLNHNLQDCADFEGKQIINYKFGLIQYKKTILDNIFKNNLIFGKTSSDLFRAKYKKNCLILKQNSLWVKKRRWPLRKANKYNKITKNRLRLKQNINVECNKEVFAFTIITKEFLNSPKYTKSKALAFTNRTNRFIRNFFKS